MWTEILKAALTLGALGLIMGVLLAVASRIFAVHTDERVEEIVAILPGANCGGCGFAGCTAYANAVVKGEASPSACVAGGAAAAQGIAKILGVDVDTRERRVAHVYCSGGDLTARRFQYTGVQTCFAASRVANGPVECTFACLGFGDCVKACAFDAIRIENGHAFVDRDRCSGCGKCAATCPRKIIDLIPAAAPVAVDCSSRYRGAFVRSVCEAGCIGCMLCTKKCEHDAIHVADNLARIDYDKCIGCGECAKVCPRGIIHEEEILLTVDTRSYAETGV